MNPRLKKAECNGCTYHSSSDNEENKCQYPDGKCAIDDLPFYDNNKKVPQQ